MTTLSRQATLLATYDLSTNAQSWQVTSVPDESFLSVPAGFFVTSAHELLMVLKEVTNECTELGITMMDVVIDYLHRWWAGSGLGPYAFVQTSVSDASPLQQRKARKRERISTF